MNKLNQARLTILMLGCSLAPAISQTNSLHLPIAPGPYIGTADSLTNYSYPEWFRDAKFGIWAHWGPQAVPMEGDWYARKMYQQGQSDYNNHLERWGHPSTNGWKDIIPLWKAENWDPEKLMELYKKAGARYFVSMGVHHDNFFLWNSKLHRWNAVQMGPHRDVVGEWQKAAKKNGLPFGVSEHLGASFTWFQDAHRSDKTGPLAGVPYDGANSNYWDLYHFPADPGDRGWYSKNPRWQQEWFNEIEELVDNYKPDLLYSDGGVPFGNEVGLSQIANFYNVNAAAHGGKCQAVYTCKQPSGGRWVQDYERGVNGGISPYPWQTDTSIGDWFYNRHWKYQPLSWIVHMLVDNRQQKRKSAAQRRAAAGRHAGPRSGNDAASTGRLDGGERRGDLWHATVAGLRRRAGAGQRRRVQGKYDLQRQGHPVHDQRQNALRDCARLAG